MLPCLVPVLFAFYLQGVLKFKCKIRAPKGSRHKTFRPFHDIVFEFDSIIFVELVTLVIPTLLATKMF